MGKLRLTAAWMPAVVATCSGSSGSVWARPMQVVIIQLIGAACSWINVVLFIWVHITLGSNWIPVPEVKRAHTLTTTGPFAIARHPMYSLLFLWCSPITALTTMNWVLTLATSCALIEFWSRIPQEDAILRDHFGEEFEAYRQDVGALGPRFWEKSFRKNLTLFQQAHENGDISNSSSNESSASDVESDGPLCKSTQRSDSRDISIHKS